VNLVLVADDELVGDRVRLDGRRARHIREVLRAAVGDELRLGVAGGRRGRAVVAAVAADAVELTVVLDQPPSPAPRVSLVLALPRPKVLGRALEAAAASGVARIDLTRAWRVDPAYLGSPRLLPAALREHLWLGCEQGATTFVPALAVHTRLMALLDGAPPWPAEAIRLVAHPRAATPIDAAVPPGDRRPVVLSIGPEGGFIDRELETFVARGFTPVSLGAAVLRSEHAVVAALAQLDLLARLR
jgi:16S rRNA (uracil1498-N3)-methyltransferase